jgi:hypothetical protein
MKNVDLVVYFALIVVHIGNAAVVVFLKILNFLFFTKI